MGLFNKKTDPISERARALSDEIAALEAEIKKLAQKEQNGSSHAPRLRSTAMPHGASTQLHPHTPLPQPAVREPIFEDVDQKRLQAKTETVTTPEHFNELGVRKYDLAALIERIKNNLRGPSTANPKLVSYLAAGSIQGLRPMRYEKRVARNRVIFIALILLALLVGVFAIIRNHH
jgi:cell division protein FtsB